MLPADHNNLRDAQASISVGPEAKPKPEAKAQVVDASPVPTARRTLTRDDLRAWANSMAAMTAEPIVTILDRWPDEELPQHRTKPTPVEQPSAIYTRTIIVVAIMFMALLAVLMTTFTNISGARRGRGLQLLASDFP